MARPGKVGTVTPWVDRSVKSLPGVTTASASTVAAIVGRLLTVALSSETFTAPPPALSLVASASVRDSASTVTSLVTVTLPPMEALTIASLVAWTVATPTWMTPPPLVSEPDTARSFPIDRTTRLRAPLSPLSRPTMSPPMSASVMPRLIAVGLLT